MELGQCESSASSDLFWRAFVSCKLIVVPRRKREKDPSAASLTRQSWLHLFSTFQRELLNAASKGPFLRILCEGTLL